MRTAAWILLALTACTPKGTMRRIETLEGQVASLEAEVLRLNQQQGSRPARPQGNPALDAKAAELAEALRNDVEAWDFAGAKAKCAQGDAEYGASMAWTRRAERLCAEVDVVGRKMAPWQVERWFQGDQPSQADTQLLVFFEQWCPHCKRELPRVQELAERHGGRLAVVGVTKVNRSATDERVQELIADQGLQFPIAKERDGAMSDAYSVTGVPAAVLIRDGEVVWRGHPAMLQRGDALARVLDGRAPTGNR